MGEEEFRERWQKDTEEWLRACGEELVVGGRIAMLIGDNLRVGVNSSETIDKAAEAVEGDGWILEVVGRASLAAGSRRPWGKQKRNFNGEHCILVEKKKKKAKL